MPSLSPSTAKRMRAHVTRTNFANRRQRIAEVRTRNAPEQLAQSIVPGFDEAIDWLLTPFANPPQQARLHSSEYPGSPMEAEWLNLLISEPALIESSLAVSMQHWVSDESRQQKTDAHSIRAVNILVQRIKSRQAHTDAVLAVVLTMAIGGRLANDNVVWNIHMDGLTQLIKERYARGICDLPSWFIDILVSFVILRDYLSSPIN
ncbi:hypothetical protein ACHAQJ_009719 [Trichoderma viride]